VVGEGVTQVLVAVSDTHGPTGKPPAEVATMPAGAVRGPEMMA
jgi:hypothetical protein